MGAIDVQCAHIRHGCYSIGMKPCDSLCVPLSCDQHAFQHAIGEVKFWGDIGAIKTLAKALYDISGDRDQALILMGEYREQNNIYIEG